MGWPAHSGLVCHTGVGPGSKEVQSICPQCALLPEFSLAYLEIKLTTIKHFYLTLPLCFLKLQMFEVLSVVKKVVLKRHVVRIPFPVNLAVNLRRVYFDKD